MDFTRNMIDTTEAPDASPPCPASLASPGLTFGDLVIHAERTYPMAIARPLKSALRRIAWEIASTASPAATARSFAPRVGHRFR